MTDTREHDIVLWGATGFTGELVAETFVERSPGIADGLRLALGGRDRAKLEGVRERLAAREPKAASLPIVIGDSHDRASLDAIAAATRVVCTTVGPYAKYGEGLVAACATHGTHYCDLTGEAQFIRRMIDRHHEDAVARGARIVNCCGFDSIPSDLGVFMLHRAFAARGGRLLRARVLFGETRGGVSGGTIASALHMFEEGRRDPSLLKLLADPYALYPRGEARGGDGREQMGVRHDDELELWTGPFVMAAINAKVVRRSNALLDFAYGREFRYTEAMSTGKGAKGLIAAALVSVGMGAMLPALALGPIRKLAAKRLPKPGEGPDREAREAGYFVARLIGEGVDERDQALSLRGRVEGFSDPGYGATATMLAESALCLARDELDSPGGLCTPASAMGSALLERLRGAGMVFRVEDHSA